MVRDMSDSRLISPHLGTMASQSFDRSDLFLLRPRASLEERYWIFATMLV